MIKNAYLAQIDTMEEYKKNKEILQKEKNSILTEIEKIIKQQETPSKSLLQLDSFIELLETDALSVTEKIRLQNNL